MLTDRRVFLSEEGNAPKRLGRRGLIVSEKKKVRCKASASREAWFNSRRRTDNEINFLYRTNVRVRSALALKFTRSSCQLSNNRQINVITNNVRGTGTASITLEVIIISLIRTLDQHWLINAQFKPHTVAAGKTDEVLFS